MDEIKRIEQLRKELHEHNYRYYVLNQPTIGDQEFDFMMHELQDLEAKHPEMADPNSPTQRVGSDLNEEFRSHWQTLITNKMWPTGMRASRKVWLVKILKSAVR